MHCKVRLMKSVQRQVESVVRSTSTRRGSLAIAAVCSLLFAAPGAAVAASSRTIAIGAIGIASATTGRAIFNGARMAVDEINKEGGVDGKRMKLYTYNDQGSAAVAVRAFQKAVEQDHVVAVVGPWISEVALALEPWAARLKTPMIVTGAWATALNKPIRNDYARFKYIFRDTFNSEMGAKQVCDITNDLFVKTGKVERAAIVSENYDWTKPYDAELLKCLPKSGVKVVSHIRFSQGTNDFTPIWDKVEAKKPNIIVVGLAHKGVKPIVQWHQLEIPQVIVGWDAPATAGNFWKTTDGAAQGVITGDVANPRTAITSKTIPFADAYRKRFGRIPSHTAYSTYDAVHILKNAIERAKSTQADKLVNALEKTDYVGTQGREVFQGRGSKFVHGLKYGKGYFRGIAVQWQHGKEVVVWPHKVATGNALTSVKFKH